MTRRRKPAVPAVGSAAAPLPPDAPSAPALASQLAGMALAGGTQPQPTSPAESSAAISAGATGGVSTGAGPSSAIPSSKVASLSVGGSSGSPVDSTPEPPPAEERACACCTVVIAGKGFRCSRCLLVYYCGKDCQASALAQRISCSAAGDPSEMISSASPPPFLFQVAHWRAVHKAVCGKPQEGLDGARLLPQPPRRVTAADRARWNKQMVAAADLINAGKYADARSSVARLVAEIESSELGRESEELLQPLDLLADSLRRAGLHDDAYNVMMRAMVLCEKHHGEEGLVTCQLRTTMGESS